MMVLKGCTRCGGDLVEERALGEDDALVCLQCGKNYYKTVAPVVEPVRRPGSRAPRLGGKSRAA